MKPNFPMTMTSRSQIFSSPPAQHEKVTTYCVVLLTGTKKADVELAHCTGVCGIAPLASDLFHRTRDRMCPVQSETTTCLPCSWGDFWITAYRIMGTLQLCAEIRSAEVHPELVKLYLEGVGA
jgi:hypothetical protein